MNKVLILLVFIAFSCNKNTEENKYSKNNNIILTPPNFDSDRAWSYLIDQTNFGPRNPNSIGHDRALQYLFSKLKESADTVLIQNFNQSGYNEFLNLSNIFASFNLNEKNRILLLAHWDTRPRAEYDKTNKDKPIIGANDGASGVAVLLEIANALKNNKLNFGIDILLTDGEDYGKQSDLEYFSLGAKYFAKNIPNNHLPKFAILVDMVGDSNLNIPIEINSLKYAPDIVKKVWDTAEELHISEFNKSTGNEIYDDHIPLNEVGIPTIDIIDFEYEYWHTQNDLPKYCSKNSLQSVGKVLLHFIYNYKF